MRTNPLISSMKGILSKDFIIDNHFSVVQEFSRSETFDLPKVGAYGGICEGLIN